MNVAAKVREFVKNRPFISEALENNIVNMSELARIIEIELKTQSVPATKAAIRRYAVDLRKSRRKREEAVLRLLQASQLILLDNLSIIVTNKDLEIVNKLKIKLSDLHYVYLVDKSLLKEARAKVKQNLCRVHEDCAALIVNSPEQMETTPGVVSYLTSLLSAQDVHSLAFASCYTETTIVVERRDAQTSYEIMSKVIG
jgi:23S rRNA-/tRNA-specific pseudouridylate synthase